MHGFPPDYKMLEVFGCAYYRHLRPYKHDKLHSAWLKVYFWVIEVDIVVTSARILVQIEFILLKM